jgi:tRNA-2-methylthio-N6-dimethylallyladenosine synthase
MPKKYLIETFGCQMNVLDSEKIAGNLQKNGMEEVDDPSIADIIILNTCSVREKAVQKVYTRLGEIKQHKNRRKDVVIGVVGCMAQLESEKILKRAPFIDILAGPQKSHIMSDLVERSFTSPNVMIDLRMDEDPGPIETSYVMRQNPWSAGVTISEGCSRQCAFCVVPTTRGKERVRPAVNIIKEVEELVSRGYIEIVLLGQTVNSYHDLDGDRMKFPELLKQLSKIKGLRRIRFSSPHPCDFSDELLEVMISIPQICNQIHLPVQSGSTKILKAMRRGYSRDSYLQIIKKIHNAKRDIAISTDLIVGFPGETEHDFEDTLSLLDEVQYDSAFYFKYSPRPNTAALALPDEISEEEKRRRLEILLEQQKIIQYNKNASYQGKIMEVLVENKARTRFSLTGRTSNNKIVNFDGPDTLMGQIVSVEISGFSPNSLKGVLLGSEAVKQPGIFI